MGGVLRIGNVMNAGNKNRGQADGFLMDSFSRTFSVRDIDGNSVMQIVLRKIFSEDEGIATFKE